MLETLTHGFRQARDRMRGRTTLSEENIAEALRTVRMALLEADVDLSIVRGFLQRVRERCEGEQVALRTGRGGRRKHVSPGGHFTRSCYEELVGLMGSPEPLPRNGKPRVLMLLGLQGTGKTSTAAKLALHFKNAGEQPLLVAADVRRPAAREQLEVLGERIGVEVYSREGQDAAAICEEAVVRAREQGHTSVILDTAGRLQIDEGLMTELESIVRRACPQMNLLVCDSMMGREAVHVAQGFAQHLKIDGLILTKLDGDARGGAALAIRSATGVPIHFVTTGEGTDRLEAFRPEGLASRILGMGDVVGLMQDFEQVIDEEKAEKEAERMLRGSFTLDDFLSQLRMIKRAGPLKDMIEKLPFAGDLFPEGTQVDGKELKRIEAMITSMTPLERSQPETLDASRRRRIAAGSGVLTAELDGMLERFSMMRQMMSQIGQGGPGGLLSKIPGLGKLMGGEMPGLDPAAMGQLGMGSAPNRRAARANQAEARRKQRKSKKKHKRRGRRR